MKKYSHGWPSCAKDWWKCEAIFDVATRRRNLAELELATSAPDFWQNPASAKEVIDRVTAEKAVLKPYDAVESLAADAEAMMELAGAEEGEAARAAALAEVAGYLEEAERAYETLEMQSLLRGPMDASNAFVTIHSGAGGTEACDWAEMLLRMYQRYAERAGFQIEMMDVSDGDEAGISSATFAVRGPNAYGYLKAERGTHRLVRISPFDANKRRHTSFAALDVIAELNDEIKVEIRDEDLAIDTYRSSGAGGQHINKTDSAIRIHHLPSGIVVSCQSERSQHSNRAKAMAMLKARLYELEEDRKRAAMDRFYGEKGAIAWGSQIRSYVLQPYTMVKDLRTGVQTSNVQAVLDGDLQPFIDGWLKWRAGKLSVGEIKDEEAPPL